MSGSPGAGSVSMLSRAGSAVSEACARVVWSGPGVPQGPLGWITTHAAFPLLAHAHEQVAETAGKHFAGEDGLWLVAVDAEALGDALRWEPSRGGQLFPHLYRALRAGDAVWARPLPLDGGAHAFPPDLA